MKATTKTLLAALLGVTALGMGASAYADGPRGHDGWRDGNRYEQRWDNRHDGWRHNHHHPGYKRNVYFYSPPPVVYEQRYYYGPTYRYPRGGSVIIDLPPIVIR